MTMTLSGEKRTGFKVGSDYYHSVKPYKNKYIYCLFCGKQL